MTQASPAQHGHHPHSHAIGHTHAKHTSRVLGLAVALTLGFMGLEIVGGLLTGSLALLADAGHMAGDGGALLLSLWIANLARKPRDVSRTFGYRRAEVIGATANGLLLVVLAIWIVAEAVERFMAPPAVQGAGVIGVAVAGLAINLVVARILAGAQDNLNVRSAMLHVLGDALGSVAALASGVIILKTGWVYADPIASTIIASLLVFGAWRLLRQTVHVLMQGAPSEFDLAQVERTIQETHGVQEVHDLHLWCVTQGEPILTAHVTIADQEHGTEVVHRVGQRLRSIHGIHHSTIQPEPAAVIVPLKTSRNG